VTSRATLKTTFWSIVASGATSAAGLVSGVLLARALGPSVRGEFAALLSWVGVMMLLSDLGIGHALSYYAGREPSRVDTLYSQGLGASILLRGVIWIVGGVVLQFIPVVAELGAPLIWVALSAVMAGGLSGVVVSLFLGTGRVRAINFLSLGGAWGYTAGIVVLWAAGERHVAAYVHMYAAILAAVCVATLWVGRRIGHFRWSWSNSGLHKLLGYGLKSQLALLASQANIRLDQVLMSILVPPEQLGYYVVAVSLSSMTSPLYSGINVVLTPKVIGSTSPRAGALWGLRMTLLALTLGGLGAIALAAASQWLLPLLFGPRFDGSLGMARVLLGAAVFQGMNLLLGTTLRGLGRPTAQGKAEAAGAVTTAALLLLLLPTLGGMGAAIASLLSYAIVSVIESIMVFQAGGLVRADLEADLREISEAIRVWHRRVDS
jgi:O-antigen/teichoic acid export membrane protein